MPEKEVQNLGRQLAAEAERLSAERLSAERLSMDRRREQRPVTTADGGYEIVD